MTTIVEPLWELRDISKAFPGVQALDNVHFTLYPGEVHALLGENGSGKSTLCKCIAGVHQPDEGQMLLGGRPVRFDHPLEARAEGVAIIYQDFSLVPALSVAENIFLGRPIRNERTGLLDWERMRRDTAALLEDLDLHIDPDTPVERLSVAEQQLIEIAKALSIDSSVLIMDEPTAALGLRETQRLLELIQRLATQGKAILYVSHRLDEVFQVADVVTIFKDGQLVAARRPVSELTMDQVVNMMVGADIEEHYPKEVHETEVPCLEVENLKTENGVNGVTFTVHKGEVFGLGGMVGAGRTEIARALFGLDERIEGTVRLEGKEVNFRSPAEAIAAGVGLVPEKRKEDGLFFNFPGPPNITMSRLKSLVSRFFLDLQQERAVGKEYVEKLSVSGNALENSVQFLSGGNQQKVVMARWLYSQARLLILDEPTRGIDVGAKLDVYNVINELTSNGIAVLLISSEYPELLAMSDRIAVIRDGQILHVTEAERLTEYQLTALASGAETSRATLQGMMLREAALPYLRALQGRLGQNVYLAILERGEMRILYLEEVNGSGQSAGTEIGSRAGAANALHATELGKVLLAYSPLAFLDELMDKRGLPAHTNSTITTVDGLQAELDVVREQGFALNREEHAPGVAGVAAPILDENDDVVAAVAVRGEAQMLEDEAFLQRAVEAVTETAAEISRAVAGNHFNGKR